MFLGRINEDEHRDFCNIFPLGGKMPQSRCSKLQIQLAQLGVGGVQIEQNAAAVTPEGGVADDF